MAINKKMKIILAVVAVCVAALAFYGIFGGRTASGAKIRVFSPFPDALVSSPLEVTGEARGYWFFEADFPVKIIDENGNLVGSGIARAKSDWMTENFVPFEAQIEFQATTEKGLLVLARDNPSDLPENDEEIRIPLKFNPIDKMTVKIFFNNSNLDPEFSCNKVFSVERQTSKTQSVARTVLEELFKGPTEREKADGFITNLPQGVKIQNLVVENGIAMVDFNDDLEFQVGGSCRVAAIRAQIAETLKQFSTVRDVIISINGRTEDILQP